MTNASRRRRRSATASQALSRINASDDQRSESSATRLEWSALDQDLALATAATMPVVEEEEGLVTFREDFLSPSEVIEIEAAVSEGGDERPLVRSRIRMRLSQLPGAEEPEEAAEADEPANKVADETHWLDLDYDDLVNEAEVRDIKRNVWVAAGLSTDEFRSITEGSTGMDYRFAWDTGIAGTEIVWQTEQRRRSVFGHRIQGIFVDVEFDGTDPGNFLRMRVKRTRRFTLDDTAVIHHFPAECLLTARFNRAQGSATVYDTSRIYPPVAQAIVTLTLIRHKFMDAMIYCLWQMMVQLSIARLRYLRQRVAHSAELREEERRLEESRRRASAWMPQLLASDEGRGPEREQPQGDIHLRVPSAHRRSSPQGATALGLFDPSPTRARMSRAIAVPKRLQSAAVSEDARENRLARLFRHL